MVPFLIHPFLTWYLHTLDKLLLYHLPPSLLTPSVYISSSSLLCFPSERKMVFLEKQCSGRVGIESGTTTSWLSGYNKMWNKESADAVCRQMHCGESSSHGYNPKTGEKVWPISYNCSSNATSLYDCNETRIQNDTFATVNCSGNVRWRSNTQFHLICTLCLLWPLFIRWPLYLCSLSEETMHWCRFAETLYLWDMARI